MGNRAFIHWGRSTKALDGLPPRLMDFPGSDFLVSVAQMKPDGSEQSVILPGERASLMNGTDMFYCSLFQKACGRAPAAP
jgi:hypothetical protein